MELPTSRLDPGAGETMEAPPGGAHGPGPRGIRRPLALGFLAILLLVVGLMVFIYRPLVRPLLWAAALATLVYPAHARCLRLVRGRATLAAALTTLGSLAVLVLPSVFAVAQLVNESRDLWPILQAKLGSQSFELLAQRIETSPFRRLAHLGLEVPEGGGVLALEERMRGSVNALSLFVQHSVRDMTFGAPGTFLHICITVVTFFFFLRHGPAWAQRLREGLPIEATQAEELLSTVARTINAVFRGVLLTAASQSLLAMLGFIVVGAPVPVLLGFLTLVAALLPFVGAVVVWLPTAAGLFLSGRVTAAIVLAAWGMLVVSLVDNFMRPYFIGRGIRLPLLWLFLAIIGGLQSFGFLGLVLGPASLALFLACYRIYVQQRRSLLVPPST